MSIHIESLEKSLAKLKEVREHRRKLYGDTWREDEDWQLLAQIVSKTNRLKNLIIDKRQETNGYDSIIDNAVDLANYTLFLLENKLNEENKKWLIWM